MVVSREVPATSASFQCVGTWGQAGAHWLREHKVFGVCRSPHLQAPKGAGIAFPLCVPLPSTVPCPGDPPALIRSHQQVQTQEVLPRRIFRCWL